MEEKSAAEVSRRADASRARLTVRPSARVQDVSVRDLTISTGQVGSSERRVEAAWSESVPPSLRLKSASVRMDCTFCSRSRFARAMALVGSSVLSA